ncbi:MAG: NAD(+)/NADH kinase [Candidatus Zixiibacteriota bacterium]
MRLGIIANMRRPDADDVIRRIIAWAEQHAVDTNLCSQSMQDHDFQIPVYSCDELPLRSDVIVSLGGDGTLLSTARAVGDHGTPILGINLGSLGFLTQITPTALEETLTAVLQKNYSIEKRMVAEVHIEEGPELEQPFALNDIVVDRGGISRIINLDLYANDYFICSYAADGLIISTPTGSTAYSLAVGGPILNPLMNAFIVSPISAFSLTTRPVIFSEFDELRIVARTADREPVLTLDGQVSCNLSQKSSFTVRKADYDINFIVFRKNSFYDVLRNKLHWGRLPEGKPGKPKYF